MNINNDYNLGLNLPQTAEKKNAGKSAENSKLKEVSASVQADLKFAQALEQSQKRIEQAKQLLENDKLDDGSLLNQTAKNILDMGI